MKSRVQSLEFYITGSFFPDWAGDLLLESIHRVLNLSCFSGTVRDLKLEFSRLDKYDTARGAAILMRNQLLRG